MIFNNIYVFSHIEEQYIYIPLIFSSIGHSYAMYFGEQIPIS